MTPPGLISPFTYGRSSLVIPGVSGLLMLGRDLPYPFRALRVAPSAAGAVIVTLALVTGPIVVLVSYLSAVAIRPLPIHEPRSLVAVRSTTSRDASRGFWRTDGLSFPEFAYVRNGLGDLAPVAGSAIVNASVGAGGASADAVIGAVTDAYFSVLGARPATGTLLPDYGAETSAPPLVVLSEPFWRHRFRADPATIGRVLEINRKSFTIVGVAATSFQGGSRGERVDAWVSLGALPLVVPDPAFLNHRDARTMFVYARQRGATNAPELRERLVSLSRQLSEAYPETNAGRYFDAVPVELGILVRLRTSTLVQLLALALASLAVVLLLASANIASIQVARAVQRERDTAVQLALGASRLRLVCHSVIEALVWAVLGSAAGALIARPCLAALRNNGLLQGADVRLDMVAMAFAACIAVVAGGMIGLAAGTRAIRLDVAGTLRSRQATAPASSMRLQHRILTAQIAGATLLTFAAALVARRASALARISPGYDVENVLYARLDMTARSYSTDERAVLHDRAVREIRELAGVRGVAISAARLLGGASPILRPVSIPGQLTEATPVPATLIGPGYFNALGIPLLHGREFDATDRAGRMNNVVISESMARRFWPDRDAVGQVFFDRQRFERRVVGVVADTRVESIEDHLATPRWYGSILQAPVSTYHVYARIDGDAQNLATDIARTLVAIDAGAAMNSQVTPLAQTKDAVLLPYRVTAWVAGAFAVLALLVSSVGIYGLSAHSVASRRAELGIRAALGATPVAIARLVIRDAVRTGATGIGLGLVACAIVSRALTTVIGQSPGVEVFAGISVCVVLLTVNVLAAFPAAREAANTEPAIACRLE